MADKPQDTTSKVVNSQEIWKYLSLFTIAVIALSLLVFVVFVVLFMPLKGARIDEIVAKLSELEGINKDMKTKVGTLEGAHIDEIVTKLSELEEINKELETKVGTLEEQLKDNALQKTCDATESTCRYHDDNLEILTSEVKKRIDSEIKSKLVELKKHMDVNDLGQIASKDIESFMKKLAEMESRFTTRLGDEIEQKLSELEQRLNGGKALENEKKHVSIINSYVTLERLQTKTYIRVDDRYIK